MLALRLPHRYAVKQTPSYVSLNNFVTRPSFNESAYVSYLPRVNGVSQIFERWSSNKIIEENVQGGSDFCFILQHTYDVTLIFPFKGTVH